MEPKIIEILFDIRERPNIYIGKPSLELLYSFLCGGICFLYFYEGKYYDFLPGFQEFLEKKYNIKENYGIVRIIQGLCNHDSEAFYKFYDLLDEFLSSQNNL